MRNPFFDNVGPFEINDILNSIDIDIEKNYYSGLVKDINDLISADSNTISFFHSNKYKYLANKTKASFCITTESLANDLPMHCKPIIVKNVLITTAKITEKFYPKSVTDNFDINTKIIEQTNYKDTVTYGKNVLIGENVHIGKNCSIGHNSIIEKNVKIGDNCSIGSNSIIRNSLIKNNVNILDSCVIGKKGFGFFPDSKHNIRYPHIGYVMIDDNAEIGCGATIDRGSMSNTVIGKNTYLDNQIHIAHNVKIGDNSIIAGQVGIAGSTIIGNNVKIGGQSGISGHLNIGNNVEIAGGSGVIRNIPDNLRVMGYPAKKIKDFIRENK